MTRLWRPIDQPVMLDQRHTLAKGMKLAMLGHLGWPNDATSHTIRNVAKDDWFFQGDFGSLPLSPVLGAYGRGLLGDVDKTAVVSQDARTVFDLGTSTNLQYFTIAIVRRKTDTTLRDNFSFCVGRNTTGINRMSAHAPYLNGNVYWDAQVTAEGRLMWDGYSISTNPEAWLFRGSIEGNRAIWFNGKEVAASAGGGANAYCSVMDTPFVINGGAGYGNVGDKQEFYQFLAWNRTLADAEIRAWFDNPMAPFWVPPRTSFFFVNKSPFPMVLPR